MSTFLLIHGGWHGAWCWEKVIPLLEDHGHIVIAPDLPGSGNDSTPVSEVSLQAYTDQVSRILADQSEPVVLVGHSLGGAVISQAAEMATEKVRALVYLAAFLLGSGENLLNHTRSDEGSLVARNMVMSEDRTVVSINEEALKDVFYADCSDTDIEHAKKLLKPQVTAPFGAPLQITDEKFGRVPRFYISTLMDKAISPAAQEKMYNALPCRKTFFLETGHSPFLSAPQQLVQHLLAVDGLI